jgi:hypothetical protein
MKGIVLGVKFEKMDVHSVFPWMEKKNIESIAVVNGKPVYIWYSTEKKRFRTIITKSVHEWIFCNVPYREGVYEIGVPFYYIGTDVLSLDSVEDLPFGVHYTPIFEHPVIEMLYENGVELVDEYGTFLTIKGKLYGLDVTVNEIGEVYVNGVKLGKETAKFLPFLKNREELLTFLSI